MSHCTDAFYEGRNGTGANCNIIRAWDFGPRLFALLRSSCAAAHRGSEEPGAAGRSTARTDTGVGRSTGKPLGTIGDEEYSVEYSQSIETFGKRAKRIHTAEISAQVAEAEYKQRSTQLAYDIRAAYAELQADGFAVAFLVKAGALLLARNGVTVRPLCEPDLHLRTLPDCARR